MMCTRLRPILCVISSFSLRSFSLSWCLRIDSKVSSRERRWIFYAKTSYLAWGFMLRTIFGNFITGHCDGWRTSFIDKATIVRVQNSTQITSVNRKKNRLWATRTFRSQISNNPGQSLSRTSVQAINNKRAFVAIHSSPMITDEKNKLPKIKPDCTDTSSRQRNCRISCEWMCKTCRMFIKSHVSVWK